MSGPSATKIWLMPAKIAMARPRSPGPNEAMTIAPDTGTISAAPAPCSVRQARIVASPSSPAGASPQPTEARKNRLTPERNARRGPSRSAALPPRATRAASART